MNREVFWTTKQNFGSINSNYITEETNDKFRLICRTRWIPKSCINSEEWFDGKLWFDSQKTLEKYLQLAHYRRDFYNEIALMSRLISDCKYCIAEKSLRTLWGKTIKEHIGEMITLWEALPAEVRPEAIQLSDIFDYKHQLEAIEVTDV